MIFEKSFYRQPTVGSLTSLLWKILHFCSFMSHHFKKTKIHQTQNCTSLTFSTKKHKSVLLKTENNQSLITDLQHTHFLSKLNQCFSLRQIFLIFSEALYSFSLENITTHKALLPIVIFGWNEYPMSTVKPPPCQLKYPITLIFLRVPTCNYNIIEQIDIRC